MSVVKNVVKRLLFHEQYLAFKNERAYGRWVAAGKPMPPPHIVKQRTVKEFGGRIGSRVFVETGTYLGDMVCAVSRNFMQIHSIELSPELCAKALQRFAHEPHISIHQGDSASVLPGIVAALREPALFWLDGHYSEGVTARGSKDTPVVEELKCILGHPLDGHVVLIDDARCFVGAGDYPTLDEVRRQVMELRPRMRVEIADDIIRIFNA